MTAKEKAKELFHEHKVIFKHYDANPKLNIGLHEYYKKCAIKTVDEILKVIHTNMEEKYYQEVKHEIEKL